VVITNPNGTELKLKLGASGAVGNAGGLGAAINDGLTADGALPVRAPGGELVLLVMPGTAEGRVVADRAIFMGREVMGLNLTVRAGRITGLNARSGGEAVRRVYDAAGAGKEQIGALVLGLNPDLRAPSGVKLCSALPEGMVSVVIGGNAWAGGDNGEAFALALSIPGSTVRVEGRPAVDEGVLTPTSRLPPEEPEDPAPPAAPK
jgi:hypothetical protein